MARLAFFIFKITFANNIINERMLRKSHVLRRNYIIAWFILQIKYLLSINFGLLIILNLDFNRFKRYFHEELCS